MSLVNCKECGIQVSTKAAICPKCGAKQPKRSIVGKVIFAIFALPFLLVMFGGSGTGTTKETQSPAATAAAPVKPAETTLADLDLQFEWKKVAFGSGFELDGVIKNKGPTSVKDIRIECVSSGPSGTVIDTNRKVLYEVVEAGKSLKLAKINMGFVHSQAASTTCSITKLAKV